MLEPPPSRQKLLLARNARILRGARASQRPRHSARPVDERTSPTRAIEITDAGFRIRYTGDYRRVSLLVSLVITLHYITLPACRRRRRVGACCTALAQLFNFTDRKNAP
jgi:hypothetical protein